VEIARVGENEAVISYTCTMGMLLHSGLSDKLKAGYCKVPPLYQRSLLLRAMSTIAAFFPSSAPKGKPSAGHQRTACNSAKNQQSVRQLDRFRGIAAAAASPAERAQLCR